MHVPTSLSRLAAPLVCLALLGCSTERNADGLGPAHALYVAARDARPQNGEVTLRRFYDAYLEAVRTKEPNKVMRFYRPDAEPEALNALRMGADFVQVLETISGEVTDVRYLETRATLRAKEVANFKFRNRPGVDSRERAYQLVRIGREWYIHAPDLGAARKPR